MSSQGYGVHFCKVLLESSLKDGELKIPKSFVKRHWQGMQNPVTLRLPNGCERKVHWKKPKEEEDDVWFCKGWKEFAEYLGLQALQFVSFQYEANSRFSVIVFGKSCLEIDYPLHHQEEVNDNNSDGSVKVLGSKSPTSHTHKKLKTNPIEENGGSDDHDLPKERIRKFLEKVKKRFSSEKDYFIGAIFKSYSERDIMAIPNEFFTTHLRNKGNATLFIEHDRTWDVDLKLSTHGQLTFTNGWRNFFLDNNMSLGDCCAFELDKSNGVSFKVTVFRISEEETNTPLSQDQEGLSHRASSSSSPHKTPETDSKMDEFILTINKLTHQVANIPFKFMKNYTVENGRKATLQVGTSTWEVTLLYYPESSSCRFSSGWTRFMSDLSLNEGDVCTFKMIDKENLVFQVSFS